MSTLSCCVLCMCGCVLQSTCRCLCSSLLLVVCVDLFIRLVILILINLMLQIAQSSAVNLRWHWAAFRATRGSNLELIRLWQQPIIRRLKQGDEVGMGGRLVSKCRVSIETVAMAERNLTSLGTNINSLTSWLYGHDARESRLRGFRVSRASAERWRDQYGGWPKRFRGRDEIWICNDRLMKGCSQKVCHCCQEEGRGKKSPKCQQVCFYSFYSTKKNLFNTISVDPD